LRQGIDRVSFHGRNNIKAIIESPVEVDKGHLEITRETLVFHGSNQLWQFSKDNISGYTTNSKYFEFKIKGLPFFQIYFEDESPLKYEDLLTDWFEKDPNHKKIIEHQPKLISETPGEPSLLLNYKEITNHDARERFSIPEFFLHLFVGLPIVTFLRLYANLILSNRQLIPTKGPFILIMNHESYLDPIIISTILPRRIAFFTKSTSFADRLLQPIFRAYRSLPNRRYEIDPQVVRHSLHVLKKGECIGIFPEGERTWNGDLLPFKYNTIKYLLSVQVPIVVASIKGAYKVLPRWTHKVHAGKIEINVQKSFSLIPGKWNIEELKRELESYFREI
jgi:1-acyl-sn-glycerol-3-phosphate acyltransferase